MQIANMDQEDSALGVAIMLTFLMIATYKAHRSKTIRHLQALHRIRVMKRRLMSHWGTKRAILRAAVEVEAISRSRIPRRDAFFNSSRPEESIVVFSFVFREEMQILGKFSAQSWGATAPSAPSRSYAPESGYKLPVVEKKL